MSFYDIPLSGLPESFTIRLGGQDYRLTLRWCDAPEGGWLLDLAEAEGATLAAGLPLLPGVDLLAGHAHLGVGGKLWCHSPGGLPPGPGDLGTSAQLIFETDDEEDMP
ncbi:hypothetical protein [Telmatospirillum sp. J64-1]|uniref:phage baseplate plug family protein n=1 Tax=Telmatospirillum sp. J64-1 TaxID=2502183 RepID=UPI00115DF281|nr:hypothetical protein [Telmatospirillum sp. J64-1]